MPKTSPPLSNLLTPSEAAHRIGISPQTLANWRCTKRYELQFIQIGRTIRYRADDIERITQAGLVKAQ